MYQCGALGIPRYVGFCPHNKAAGGQRGGGVVDCARVGLSDCGGRRDDERYPRDLASGDRAVASSEMTELYLVGRSVAPQSDG